jgi:dimethylaniline monooxygenase (N-oxide forming)
MSTSKQICVIGAGAAGLTSIKSCLEEDFNVICYEKTDNIGGLWRYREDEINGVGRVQKATIINTSKEMISYSDFPVPKEFPNYMHNTQLVKYFEMYAQKFDLIKHIKFEHSVVKIEKNNDYDKTGKWKVTTRNEKSLDVFTEIFNGVMVCTGRNAIPRMPQFPGQDKFKGRLTE